MASASNSNQPLPTGGPTAGGDELDDLFDYDGGLDDPFSENYVVPGQKKDTTDKAPKNTGSKEKGGAGLGIDEEIEVTRKPRAPRVKLDEHKYESLSSNQLPLLIAEQDSFQQPESQNSARELKTTLNSKAKATSTPMPPACSPSTNCGLTTSSPKPAS